MKTYRFIIMALLLSAALIFNGGKVNANTDEKVSVYGEYLTDSNGYTYGEDWFVDSYVNAQIYVVPRVISKNNVNGDVVSGTVLLDANEKHFRVGSFMCKDRNRSWSVYFGV